MINYTTASEIVGLHVRYYQERPENKSLQQVWSHGADHRFYEWAPHLDTRWTDEQIVAYCAGYNGEAAPV